jgi:DNA-binding MarR family transcriptional regulator
MKKGTNEYQAVTYSLHKVVYLLDKLAEDQLKEKLGITFSLFRILIAIDNKTVSQCEIARYWEMTEAAVSRQIDILDEKGFISREKDKENRRQNNLSLTETGKKILKQSVDVLEETHAKMYQNLDKKELELLETTLEKLLQTVCTETDEDCDCD